MSIVLNDKYKKIINQVTEYFFENIAEMIIKTEIFDILVSNDIINDLANYDKITTQSLLGTVIVPNENREKFIVLINENCFSNDGLSAVSPILHECIHLVDYIQFGRDYCNSNYKEIERNELFRYFFICTEFHAYLIQSIYTQLCIQYIDIRYLLSDSLFIESLLYVKFPNYNKDIVDYIKKYNINHESKSSLDLWYHLTAYLGHYCACNLFSIDLNNGALFPDEVKELHPTIIPIYDKLFEMRCYELAKLKFKEFADFLMNLS